MPTVHKSVKCGVRVFKDGCRMVQTEYEVRSIDEHGDCQDIDHWNSLAEAEADARKVIEPRFDPEGKPMHLPASVIELHVSRMPAHLFGEPDTFTTIATFGDTAALEAGGWIEGDQTFIE